MLCGCNCHFFVVDKNDQWRLTLCLEPRVFGFDFRLSNDVLSQIDNGIEDAKGSQPDHHQQAFHAAYKIVEHVQQFMLIDCLTPQIR